VPNESPLDAAGPALDLLRLHCRSEHYGCGTETVAVLALASEPIEVIGCAGLLVVYLIAGVVSVFSADLIGVLRFIFYAAVAAYIVLASRTNQVANHGQG
jgi:hypothetical protein